MKLQRQQEELQQRFRESCGWCGTKIGEEQPVFGSGGRVRSDIDLEELQGQVLELQLVTYPKKVLIAFTTFDSPAKTQGNDFVFMICSEQCGREMKKAIDLDIQLGNALGFPS